ncbi:MAG: HepT-like ribonuclease domain-containing protein, partial [Stellaceae bacterium]
MAASFAAGFDFDSFRDDPRTVYAVTRCLEIISEASRRLPDELKARHPAIAWKDMAGAGNIYRHDYE